MNHRQIANYNQVAAGLPFVGMTVARAFVLFTVTLQAADWLNEGGDAHQRNFQALERELTPASVPALKLIWKRKLGEQARLSSPIIMGRLITFRGTVELVFVTSSDGHVYAVDGDFGKVFWDRKLDSQSDVCRNPATPALTPNPPDVDPDDDGEQPKRPLYVLAPDAMLHSLNPIDGKDGAMARPFHCSSALVVKRSKAAALKTRRVARAVTAGGVAFVLIPSTGELQAFDAVTHAALYRSGPTSPTTSALAVANGHVCFTASDAALYCFGFPLDR